MIDCVNYIISYPIQSHTYYICMYIYVSICIISMNIHILHTHHIIIQCHDDHKIPEHGLIVSS